MSVLSRLFRLPTVRHIIKKPGVSWSCAKSRYYADQIKTEITKDKHNTLQGTENEQRMRVRRARPADIPRVLGFVRENARTTRPALVSAPASSHLILCDYIARALSQGHSMLAEQQESRRGWSQIRGLALGLAVCPWDAMMLDKWARCIRCSRSKRLMHFTAQCLRAPGLHEKYKAHNILQVILIIPQNSPKNSEVVHLLTKNIIQRGREIGIPVLRFDVTDSSVAKALDELKLNKEWQVSYDVLHDALKTNNTQAEPLELVDETTEDLENTHVNKNKPNTTKGTERNLTVYTVFPDKNLTTP